MYDHIPTVISDCLQVLYTLRKRILQAAGKHSSLLYSYLVHDDHLLTIVARLGTQPLTSRRDRGPILPSIVPGKGSPA